MTRTRVPLGQGVVLLCAVQFVDVLGVTSATTALPAVATDLAASPAAITAIATAYAAFFGGFLMLGSFWGERWGHRRVLLLGLALFATVAVAGGLATSPLHVVGARALQGFAAAISVPSALRLLMHLTPEADRRTRAIAAWSAAGALAGALGFLVGGFLSDGWGWRAIFWINAPIGLVLAALAGRWLPPLRREGPPGRLDVLGAALLVASLTAIIAGATLSEDPATRPLGFAGILGGIALGIAFAARLRVAAHPLIPAEALRAPDVRTGVALSFANTATTSSTSTLVALQLQSALGASATATGLMLLPLSVAVVVGSAAVPRLRARIRPQVVAGLGLALIAGGNTTIAVFPGAVESLTVGVALLGLGLGLASVAATEIGTSGPERLGGTATGLINTAAQVGTALGIAVFLTLAASLGPGGFPLACGAIAVAAATAAFLGWRARPGDRGRRA